VSTQVLQLANDVPPRSSFFNIGVLAVTFALSFATYFTEQMQVAIQLIPVMALIAFVVLQLILPHRWPKRATLFRGEGSLVLWLIPILTCVASLESKLDKSPQYWALITLVLLLSRLLTSRIPLRDLLDGFYWSGLLCMLMLLALAGSALRESVDTLSRFSQFGFHPNTLGFIFAGYFSVAMWKIVAGKRFERISAVMLAVTCLVIIFFASSRGSLVALGAGMLGAGILWCVRRRKWALLVSVCLLAPILAWGLMKTTGFGEAADYTDKVLQLSEGDRGMDSGLTGRVQHWQATWARLARGSWLWGNGVRASDGLPFAVDNGYLVVLYDLGIIPCLLILGRFATLAWRFFWRYLALGKNLDLAVLMILAVFLVNNIVDRYLFGVGNPFSLMAFIMLVAPWTTASRQWRRAKSTRRSAILTPGPAPVRA
jgi:hypothetical protein